MTAIFSRVRLNTRQVAAMVVFVVLASLAQMVAPALVNRVATCRELLNQSSLQMLTGHSTVAAKKKFV